MNPDTGILFQDIRYRYPVTVSSTILPPLAASTINGRVFQSQTDLTKRDLRLSILPGHQLISGIIWFMLYMLPVNFAGFNVKQCK